MTATEVKLAGHALVQMIAEDAELVAALTDQVYKPTHNIVRLF